MPAGPDGRRNRRTGPLAWLRRHRLFVATVLVPTVLAALYFGLLASDVYISESRFVVRSPQKPVTTGLGMILQSAGFSRSTDDSYTVGDYMLSRDALRGLDQELGLAAAWSSASVDRISRFAGLDWDDSFEALHRYYGRRVQMSIDTVTAISTLRTSSFDADSAHRMNERLLVLGEQLVNQLNERGRQDLMKFAAAEVADAERRSRLAAQALSEYRTRSTVLDPERQAAPQFERVLKLQDELTTIQLQLAQLQSLTPDNPQIEPMQRRARLLRAEIAAQQGRIAGGERSLANKAAEFQRLVLDREFADRQLAAALASLEQARNEAQRKQLYLERIVQPARPDAPVEPRRIRAVAATILLGLVAWGVLALLVAGIREHRD